MSKLKAALSFAVILHFFVVVLFVVLLSLSVDGVCLFVVDLSVFVVISLILQQQMLTATSNRGSGQVAL